MSNQPKDEQQPLAIEKSSAGQANADLASDSVPGDRKASGDGAAPRRDGGRKLPNQRSSVAEADHLTRQSCYRAPIPDALPVAFAATPHGSSRELRRREDGAEPAKVEGLRQVIVESGLHPAFAVFVRSQRGECDCPLQGLALSSLADQLQPIAIGQADVAEQHVEAQVSEQDQSISYGASGRDVVSAMVQQTRKHHPGIGVIFHEQNVHTAIFG